MNKDCFGRNDQKPILILKLYTHTHTHTHTHTCSSVPLDSASMNSTTDQTYLEKRVCTKHAHTFFVIIHSTIQYNNYLHSIHIALGNTGDVQTI
jgi:hypothetical protein